MGSIWAVFATTWLISWVIRSHTENPRCSCEKQISCFFPSRLLMGLNLKPLLLQRSVLQPPSKGPPRWPLENRCHHCTNPQPEAGSVAFLLSFHHTFLRIIVIRPTKGHLSLTISELCPSRITEKLHQIAARRELSVSS